MSLKLTVLLQLVLLILAFLSFVALILCETWSLAISLTLVFVVIFRQSFLQFSDRLNRYILLVNSHIINEC